MSAGSPLSAAVWTVLVGIVLLVWPLFLVRLNEYRPSWFDGLPVSGPSPLNGSPRTWHSVVGWVVMAVVAAVLPVSSYRAAAHLDAGLFWILAAGCVGWALQDRVDGARAGGAVLALTGACLPVVLRTGTLNLTDIGIAQQGGAGSWFLVREPFLAASGCVFLLVAAALWAGPSEDRAATNDRSTDPWWRALTLGWPLVASHLFVTLYLGGWWAFATFLDGAPWLNVVLKSLIVFAALVWLRRRAWLRREDLLAWWLPIGGIVLGLASGVWMVVSGAVL